MVDLYQTGIIVTFILVVSGSMFGVLARIDQEDDGIDFGIPETFNSIYSTETGQSNIETMVAALNTDFNSAASSSNLASQTILFGSVLIQGTIIIASLIIAAFTSWFAIVTLLFAFTAGTPIVYLAEPIKIILSIVIIYTIVKFLGDIISHLPFFGGG